MLLVALCFFDLFHTKRHLGDVLLMPIFSLLCQHTRPSLYCSVIKIIFHCCCLFAIDVNLMLGLFEFQFFALCKVFFSLCCSCFFFVLISPPILVCSIHGLLKCIGHCMSKNKRDFYCLISHNMLRCQIMYSCCRLIVNATTCGYGHVSATKRG